MLMKRNTKVSEPSDDAASNASFDEEHDPPPIFVRGSDAELSLTACCVRTIARNFDFYESLEGLPQELVQHIFYQLNQRRTLALRHLPLLSSVVDGALANCPALTDDWLTVLGDRFGSLSSLDLSGCTAVTDDGVKEVARLTRLATLKMERCLRIGDAALQSISGLTRLSTLSVAGCSRCSDPGVACLGSLVALTDLNLEQLPRLHDAGLTEAVARFSALTNLNIGWTKAGDELIAVLPGRERLTRLNLSFCHLTARGVGLLSALSSITALKLPGCKTNPQGGSGGALVMLSSLAKLRLLDLSQCDNVADDTLAGLCPGLTQLRSLHLAHTQVTDSGVAHLTGLLQLRSLVLDCCHVTNAGIHFISRLTSLTRLDLSDNAVTSSGVGALTVLSGLTHLNLFSTGVSDTGANHISHLLKLRILNLDSRLITDLGLVSLTCLTDLQDLDLFGARITEAGAVCIGALPNLTSLELCGGGMTDEAVAALQHITRMRSLNLSQNDLISDRSVPHLLCLSRLVSLNLAGTALTHVGVESLTLLTDLVSLCISGCRVPASTMAVVQAMPNLRFMTS